MMNFVENNEAVLRLSVFLGMLFFMAILEALTPKKARVMPRKSRWITNLLLVVIDSLVLRLITPILAVSATIWAERNHIGLLNLVDLHWALEALIAFLLLDMLIYFQHVLSHRLPIFWMFHKVHHTDRDIDVTSGVRFHPVEIVFSMFLKLFFVLLIGPSAFVVVLFEMVLNGAALFNHANLALPKPLDRTLRLIIVTPDFHRVHHSVIEKETNSNYGFFLSMWDRIFGTYIPQPSMTHKSMSIGLAEHQTKQPNQLLWSLLLPWSKKTLAEGKRSD